LHQVRKAVIPAAGLGTRFLPATKSVPKEMLPVIDRPAIQYVVEEAVRAGITDILLVTGRRKAAIEDHFDRNFELETLLERDGKHELLKEVQRATDLADVHYVRQKDARGLGHAVSVARHHIGDEPFAVLLPDELMIDDSVLLRSMVDAWNRLGHAIIGLEEVPPEEISAYGCADPAGPPEHGLVPLRGIVEKPPRDAAPSNLAVSGRYIFRRRSSTRSIASNPARAASSSSRTRSPCCYSVNRSTARSAASGVTTSARRSTSCERPSSSRSTEKTSAPNSRSSCARRCDDAD
jgi:UTP--glucose-1-phosphate uridylyltransferase